MSCNVLAPSKAAGRYLAACCAQQGVSGAAPARLHGLAMHNCAIHPWQKGLSYLQCSAGQRSPVGAALLRLCKQAGERGAWHSCHDV